MNKTYYSLLKSSFELQNEFQEDVWSSEEVLKENATKFCDALMGEKGCILDIGAGSGRDCEYFVKQGWEVVGVDICRHSGWERIQKAWNGSVTFKVGNFMELRIERRFDAILDNGCFHHQHPDDVGVYLKKVHGLLVPNGLFCLLVYYSDRKVYYREDFAARYSVHYSETEIKGLLSGVGFGVVTCRIIDRVERRGGKYLSVICRS